MGTLVEHESPEAGLKFVAFNDIHQAAQVFALRQGCRNGDDGVALAHQRNLEGFGIIDLSHIIAAMRFGNEFERRARKARRNLGTRIGEAWTFRVVEADASDVLDVLVGRFNDCPFQGKGGAGL